MSIKFSSPDWAGILSVAEAVFSRKYPVIAKALREREMVCSICKEKFSDFFEHFPKHINEILIDMVATDFYLKCIEYVEEVENEEGSTALPSEGNRGRKDRVA